MPYIRRLTRQERVDKHRSRDAEKIKRLRTALLSVRLKDIDQLLDFKPLDCSHFINMTFYLSLVILNMLTLAFTIWSKKDEGDTVLTDAKNAAADWTTITFDTLVLPVIGLEAAVGGIFFIWLFIFIPIQWKISGYGSQLLNDGVGYLKAGGLLVAWSQGIRFLCSFSILRMLSLMKLAKLRIFFHDLYTLTLRIQAWIKTQLECCCCDSIIHAIQSIAAFFIWFGGLLAITVGVLLSLVGMAVKLGVMVKKVPFISDASNSFIDEWSVTQVAVFLGFVNQITGIQVPEEHERFALTRLVFGGEKGYLLRSDVRNADYFYRLGSSAMFVRYRGWLGAWVFCALEADQLQKIFLVAQAKDPKKGSRGGAIQYLKKKVSRGGTKNATSDSTSENDLDSIPSASTSIDQKDIDIEALMQKFAQRKGKLANFRPASLALMTIINPQSSEHGLLEETEKNEATGPAIELEPSNNQSTAPSPRTRDSSMALSPPQTPKDSSTALSPPTTAGRLSISISRLSEAGEEDADIIRD